MRDPLRSDIVIRPALRRVPAAAVVFLTVSAWGMCAAHAAGPGSVSLLAVAAAALLLAYGRQISESPAPVTHRLWAADTLMSLPDERSAGRALIAEDNEASRTVARRMLERAGYGVQTVETGLQAVEAVASGRFDVVLMDMHMPELDGPAATRAIRRLPGLASATPVVAMTTDGICCDRERCLAAAMDDYIAKPVRREELLGAMRRWVKPV